MGCSNSKQCGSDCRCISKGKKCPKSRYDDIFAIEETGSSMGIDNLESDVDLEMDQFGRMPWGHCCSKKPKGTYILLYHTTYTVLHVFRHALCFAVKNGNQKN